MRLTKSFTKEDVKNDQKIVIYGAGVYGELALRGLETLGLEPVCFIDRAHAGTEYLGIPVEEPQRLEQYTKEVVLLASYNYFYDMLAYVQEVGVEDYYDIMELINLDYPDDWLTEYALDEKKNDQKYLSVIENCGNGKLVICHCEIVVTERCTLKCRDCANLMQYYEKPEDLDIEDIIQYFKVFLQSIDMLLELRILGGEPFMNQEIDKLITAFIGEEKIKRITIYTNSTIVPKEKIVRVLKDKKVSVHMSDYGVVSRNIDQLEELFKKEQIQYYIHHYDKWHDLGDLSFRGYDAAQMKALYKNCQMSKCYTFYRGKLYLCPRSAHGEQVLAFENGRNEYVDFTDENCDAAEKRKQIETLIDKTQTITACNYCNASNSRSREVDAAKQMERVEK